MRYKHSLLLVLAAAATACSGERDTTAPTPPIPPAPSVLLKDIEIPHLPSPYYHFEYDTEGRYSAASFASGLTMYEVTYDGGRIKEMRNNIIVNHDRLVYLYDNAGRVSTVSYTNSNGLVFTRLRLSYDGQKLSRLQRERLINSDFVIDKTMSFSYYADGNLLELTEHRPAIDGLQDETATVDHFEQYDDKINVDGFSLIHDDFFDHLILLPEVQLQKGNPGKQTHTGDGTNYTVDYTYTYDDRNRPLAKNGDLTFLNGAEAGQRFQTQSVFTYY